MFEKDLTPRSTAMNKQGVKYSFVAVIAVLACLLASCDTMEVVEPPPEEEAPGLFAFSAEFTLDGELRPRIILAPFDNPSAYQIIDDLFGYDPRFSPDKSKILFWGYGEDVGPNAYIYHIDDQSTEPVIDFEEPDSLLTTELETAVWDAAGTGFYFNRRSDLFTDHRTFYYAFEDSIDVFVHNLVQPVDRISPDTLLVKDPGDFFLFVPKSGDLIRLDNPHLDFVASFYSPRSIDWSERRRLFVIVQGQWDTPGSRIAITNLDGSVYRELTSGEYLDHWPRWGPGEEVLFRRVVNDFGGPAEIAAVHVETGEVRTLLRSEDLGASTLYELDY